MSTKAKFSTLYKRSSIMAGVGDSYDKVIYPKNYSYIKVMERKKGGKGGRKKEKSCTFRDMGL